MQSPQDDKASADQLILERLDKMESFLKASSWKMSGVWVTATAGLVSAILGPLTTYIQKTREIELADRAQIHQARMDYLERVGQPKVGQLVLRYIASTAHDSQMRSWAEHELTLVNRRVEQLEAAVREAEMVRQRLETEALTARQTAASAARELAATRRAYQRARTASKQERARLAKMLETAVAQSNKAQEAAKEAAAEAVRAKAEVVARSASIALPANSAERCVAVCEQKRITCIDTAPLRVRGDTDTVCATEKRNCSQARADCLLNGDAETTCAEAEKRCWFSAKTSCVLRLTSECLSAESACISGCAD